MIYSSNRLYFFLKNEDGLSAVEYIVAGTLVVVLLVAGFALLGTTVDNRLLFLRNALSWE
ncbi:Flp family type IVb pilin [Vibrio plantisponsor]|uniref:Flp family type IVb pilin n=1 Tax=Vibrio plantisponsor TaxID=664643 RepID=A0ABU4IF49_9VIBR|nr:Flp family type IVb pilin [Vibrio plantisponsor]MDW6016170.1 Flp family type IVb pilin [Vibrio plantisponsor]NNM41198.1 Flp family type IVb pilin [Vibrio plantisponsor]